MISIGKKFLSDLISSIEDVNKLMQMFLNKRIPVEVRSLARKELDQKYPRYRREYLQHLKV